MNLEQRSKRLQEIADQQKQQEKELLSERKQRLAEMARVLNTAEGIAVFRRIKDLCGYQDPSVCMNGQGSLDPYMTNYNEARRDIWLELRKFISRENLILIELPPVAQAEGETESADEDPLEDL